MASWKTNRPGDTARDLTDLAASFSSIVDGDGSGTLIVLPVVSGHLNPFTEEWTTTQSETHWPASGIVCQVTEGNLLLGFEGKVTIGDLMVSYPYDRVSGIIHYENIETVKLLSPVISGDYSVQGMMVDTLRGKALTLDLALKLKGFNA